MSDAQPSEVEALREALGASREALGASREALGASREALAASRRVEDELRASLETEKQARATAEASDAFKEVFLGILGHDLRNPLNTILTTARLMVMRGELPPESQKRLERVVVSGVRIDRMIDQLFDLTRARLAGGILVTPAPAQDLVPLVSNIVAEMRSANPTRTFELRAEGPCTARVDGDRFQQVVSNLLGNAITHGDREKPITIVLATRGDRASLTVHNQGTPIAPESMPFLFDPFQRGKRPRESRPGGLGLGLYITERIVTAHGGTITVTSSREDGTSFEATFPRGA